MVKLIYFANMYQLDNIKKLPPLECLRSFVLFIESENITKAAETLGISQPLLSLHLKRLEEHLGTPLFEFVGKKKILNSVGKAIYPLIRENLNELSTDLKLTVLQQTSQKSLRFGGRKEILDLLVQRMNFDGSLLFRAMGGKEVETRLRDREIEVGISQVFINSSELIRKKYWSDYNVLFWSRTIKVKDTENIPDLLQTLSPHRCFHYGPHSILETFLKTHGIGMSHLKILEFSDWNRLLALCSEKIGWGIAPSSFMPQFSKQLNYRKLDFPFNEETSFYLYYQKGLAKIPWSKELIQQVLDLKK